MAERPSELLPCPFCGTPDPQVYQKDAGTKQSEWVICCNGHWCDARVSSDGSGSKDSAFATWNRRTLDAAPSEPSAEHWRRAISDWNGDHPRDPDAAYLKRIEQRAREIAREWK